MRREIIVTRNEDGSCSADCFPEQIAVTPQLLALSDPEFLEACVHFNMANGYAEYHVVGWDVDARALICERVDYSPKDMGVEDDRG